MIKRTFLEKLERVEKKQVIEKVGLVLKKHHRQRLHVGPSVDILVLKPDLASIVPTFNYSIFWFPTKHIRKPCK